jgi:hypothetical protein
MIKELEKYMTRRRWLQLSLKVYITVRVKKLKKLIVECILLIRINAVPQTGVWNYGLSTERVENDYSTAKRK